MQFLKTALLSSLIAYAGSAIAATQTSNDSPMPVMVTSPDSCFEMSFSGLALQPFANNLSYAAEALPFNYGDSQPAVSPSWVIPTIKTGFDFGFDLEASTVFRDAQSSLMLNWERFHSSKDKASITVPFTTDMVGTFFEIGPDASTYKKGKGTVTFHFDEVNLDYGTFVKFSKLLRMNLFAGVGFSRLVQNLETTISNLPNTLVRTITIPAKFIGAGPQFGFNVDYKIYKGLEFVANTRATLFVGTFTNSTTYSTKSADLVTLGDQNPNIQTTSVDDQNGVVPGFEGKLGFAYEYLFRCRYLFKLEAGYQAQVYLDAIRSIDMGSEVTLGTAGTAGSSTTGVYARTFDRTVSNFALAGPYAKLSFAF